MYAFQWTIFTIYEYSKDKITRNRILITDGLKTVSAQKQSYPRVSEEVRPTHVYPMADVASTPKSMDFVMVFHTLV